MKKFLALMTAVILAASVCTPVLAATQDSKKTVPRIVNGIYSIRVKIDGKEKYLDIAGGSRENNANLQLWDDNDTNAQLFYVRAVDAYWYQITNLSSNLALDVENGLAVNGTNVRQHACNGSDAQQWTFSVDKDGWTIRSRVGSKVLEAAGGKNENGTNVQIADAKATDGQRFYFSKAKGLSPWCFEGVHTIVSKGGMFTVDSKQEYVFIYNGNGYYRIRNNTSGKAMTTVSTNSIEDFMSHIESVMTMARENHYKYGNSRSPVPCADGIISCDRLIARALWDMGYTDQPVGGMTCGMEEAYLTSHGFTKITDRDLLQRGDVIFQMGSSAATAHTFVLASYDKATGNCTRYDAGSDSLFFPSQPIEAPMEYNMEHPFVCAFRLTESDTMTENAYTQAAAQLFRITDNNDGTVKVEPKSNLGSSAAAQTWILKDVS